MSALDNFYKEYKQFGWYDTITIQCQNADCTRVSVTKKQSAVNNIKRNGFYKCRPCSYTPEGKDRIAKATSYKRSPNTCKKMAESANKKWATPEGKKLKSKLSKLTAKQISTCSPEKHKRRGLYPCKKTGELVAYNSSYELRLCWLLDFDEKVKSYQTQVYYEVGDRGRSLDFLIEYHDDPVPHAIEVKPKKRLNEEQHRFQLEDSAANAAKEGWRFEIYTEDNFGMSYKEIRDWADELRLRLDKIDYKEHRMEKDREKGRRYYEKRIKDDRITVYCEYCNEDHEILKLIYNKNINRNGRYICKKESDEKPKKRKKKENPYAAEGKKQCVKCSRILPFDCFHLDKTRSDGYCTKCKECRKGIEPK